jgi:ribosome maturation factor RimP
MSTTSVRQQLCSVLPPLVEAVGADLEDIELTPAGKRRLLRLVVDRDGGITLDDVAAISQAVSEMLDASDVMGGQPYVLEVTSPGVERPLTMPRHWRRNAGRLVTVTLPEGGPLRGRIVSADEDGVDLDVDGTARRLGWDEARSGRVEIEFNRKDGPSLDGVDVLDAVDGDHIGEEGE